MASEPKLLSTHGLVKCGAQSQCKPLLECFDWYFVNKSQGELTSLYQKFKKRFGNHLASLSPGQLSFIISREMRINVLILFDDGTFGENYSKVISVYRQSGKFKNMVLSVLQKPRKAPKAAAKYQVLLLNKNHQKVRKL